MRNRPGKFSNHVVPLSFTGLLLTISLATAQPKTLHFERLSLSEGLSSYVVTSLKRDGTGFLWVGTQSGLNRYDGIRFRIFFPSFAEDSLPDYGITALVEDGHQQGVLWIGTERGGLAKFNPETEQFTTFTKQSSSIGSNKILSLYMDGRGKLWIGTEDAGLNSISPTDTSFRIYSTIAENIKGIPGNKIEVLFEPKSVPGQLWIGTDSGLSILDMADETFYDSRKISDDTTPLSHGSVTAIAETQGSIWVGMENGFLYRYNPMQRSFKRINKRFAENGLGKITALVPSKLFPGVLWIGTRGQGLIAFNTRTDSVRHFGYVADNPTSLSRNDILSVFEDDSGLLWVGTVLGLNKAVLHPRRFEPILLDSELSNSGIGPSVGTLYETQSNPGIVWISVLREGLRRYDRKIKKMERFPISADSLEVIFAMCEDSYGNFWLGSTYTALFHLNQTTGVTTSYSLATQQPTLITQIYVQPSQPEFLWISMRRLGLVKFDVRLRKVVKRYTVKDGLSGNDVWSVYEPPTTPGILWVISSVKGLNRLDTRTHEIEILRKSDKYCLPSDDILTVAEDSYGILWLGTLDAGLVRFDPQENTCATFTRSDGLPYTDISAILEDSQKRLWLSTSNGLSLFNPREETFTNFTVKDGLQGQIFHYQAWQQNHKGEMLFGGANGINIFHPDSIRVIADKPNIVLTEFLVDGEPYKLERTENGFRPVELLHFQNDLAFEFAALDLVDPLKNRYKVKLEEADEGWQNLGAQRSQRYPALSPGKYTFRVIGSNSDGYWNTEGVSLDFEIMPPFWSTWWFWTLISTLAFGLVIGAYQYRIYQLKQLERTRKRIADDLHDDIGSKMSSIALMIEMTGKDLKTESDQKEQLDEISETAREVVDDLRDTVWLVDAENDDLPALVRRMKGVTAQILRGQQFYFQKPDRLPELALRMEQRRNLFLIYKEMIHNVMRHAKASNIEIQISYTSNLFTIRVDDDGVGFDPENVECGRGLATLQKRAELLKGNFQIESKPGEGTKQHVAVKIV